MVTMNAEGRAEIGLKHGGEPIRSFYDIPEAEVFGADQDEMRHGQERFHAMTMVEDLEGHREFGEFQLIGNVHGYTLGDAIYRVQAGQAGRTVAIVNLVRNPIGQILSFNRRHLFDARRDDTYMAARIKLVERRLDLASSVRDTYGIDLSDQETLIFLSTAIDVAALQRDVLIDKAVHVPYELITNTPEAFERFLGLLFGNADIEIPKAYVEDVFSQGPMNYSSKAEAPIGDAFASLEDWQQSVIVELVGEDVIARFTGLGYDLGFFEAALGAANG